MNDIIKNAIGEIAIVWFRAVLLKIFSVFLLYIRRSQFLHSVNHKQNFYKQSVFFKE